MRLAALLSGAVIAGLAAFEVMMQPSPSERIELGVILAGMATLALVTARVLPRLSLYVRSIRRTMALLAVAGFAIVVLGTLAVANRMFLSEHDLRLLLVVLGFGVLATMAFAVTVSLPLSADIDLLSEQASLVANGSLDTRLELERRDEVGRLSGALTAMIQQLDAAESTRRANEESRQVFFSSIGHDLRTPLASLRASVEAIQDGLMESPADSLATMERDIEAMTRLVEDLNLLARLDAGALELEKTEIDVTEIADEAIDVFRPLARSRSVALSLLAVERIKATGHPGHVGRALRNLIDNALRHTPAQTEVTIEVTRCDGAAVVLVTDEGPGFDPGFAPSAFERFSRAEPSRARDGGGSGLGLAIVKGLITGLDGRVWIDPGPGGKVGLELPGPTDGPRPAQLSKRSTILSSRGADGDRESITASSSLTGSLDGLPDRIGSKPDLG